MKGKMAFLLCLFGIFVIGCSTSVKTAGKVCFGGPGDCKDPEIELKVVK